jgi:hypothetical protein
MMKEYISFMKAVCWTLLAALIIFALFSWRGYNGMIVERFKWERYWEEVKEDEYLLRLAERKAREDAIDEKRKAMYAARAEKCKDRILERKHK